jgi:RHS repeat-associated protein
MSNFQNSCLTYNALNPLISAVASGGTGGTYTLENYNYDSSTGNLSSKGGVSYTYNAQVSCTAGNRTIPHAVSGAGGNSYVYDCNGNQVTRTIGGSTYNLSYDGENRLTGVSGAATASFVYDGDGQRVKGTVSGVTTTYVHNYFEWTGSTSSMKKYYYDGATRVAMRTGNSTGQTTGLNWLFGDHLGSTSITADSGGNRSGELRYKGWGETRYNWGTTPTSYQFTGQRNESTLGLYFYNSRWLDPALGRFIQADPVVPNPLNSQSLDRYAYVLNNPLKYIDPSGHMCTEFGSCQRRPPFVDPRVIFVTDPLHPQDWTDEEKAAVHKAVDDVSVSLANAINKGIDKIRSELKHDPEAGPAPDYVNPVQAFLDVFGGPVIFSRSSLTKKYAAECTGKNNITVYNLEGAPRYIVTNSKVIAHELGHAIIYALGSKTTSGIRGNLLRPDYGNQSNGYHGFAGPKDIWQFGGLGKPGDPPAIYEIFADMFVGWVYDQWTLDDPAKIGPDRQRYMNTTMVELLVSFAY